MKAEAEGEPDYEDDLEDEYGEDAYGMWPFASRRSGRFVLCRRAQSIERPIDLQDTHMAIANCFAHVFHAAFVSCAKNTDALIGLQTIWVYANSVGNTTMMPFRHHGGFQQVLTASKTRPLWQIRTAAFPMNWMLVELVTRMSSLKNWYSTHV